MIYLYSNEIIKNFGSIFCNISFNFFADCLCVVFVFKRRIVSDFNHLQPLSDITVHFRTVTSNFGQKRLLSEIFFCTDFQILSKTVPFSRKVLSI